MEWLALVLFAVVFVFLLAGFPVAFTLGGTALLFALGGAAAGIFDLSLLHALPNRLYGIMVNETLIAVPLFIFMGVMLERSRVADSLLQTMGEQFGSMRGGLGIAVMVVGMMLAASTGIVGATVVTMGLLALPTMLKHRYDPAVATGSICASGTLGQIIPPSIILVLLGEVLSSAFTEAQLEQGIYSPDTVSVGDLFAGALIPGLVLVGAYILYLVFEGWRRPEALPALDDTGPRRPLGEVARILVPPVLLIVAVLGSIMAGAATPTEAASVGAVGAMLLAATQGHFSLAILRDVMRTTTRVTSMVFMIFVGASLFSLVFRGLGGDDLVHELLTGLPGGTVGALLVVMVVMFLLGFVLDFIEITFVVVPIVAPVLFIMGVDPVWLGVMIAINLQTSFLTPPFGFALFYLRGVAPPEVATGDIYRGVAPFIAIQLAMLGVLALFPGLATWLPGLVFD